MYSITYGEESEIIINRFVFGYIHSFIKLYKDSGLENEGEILQNYDSIGQELLGEIRSQIRKQLRKEEIFGYKILDGKRSVKIFLKSFMLEVFYEEDTQEKIRFIENIEINKK